MVIFTTSYSRKQKQPSVNTRVPDFVIAGAKKCGTGTLGIMLAMHPLLVRYHKSPYI